MFALDTNTVIHFFKAKGRVAEHLRNTAPARICVPSVVVHELETVVLKSPEASTRRRQLDSFLDSISVLPFDTSAAKHAARIRARLEAQGMPIGPLDVLIAGTSMAHGTTLVTRNQREFQRVEGLATTNWYD